MIDCFSSQARYARHLAPVWDALDSHLRGAWPTAGSRPVMVASYGDLRRTRRLKVTGIAHLEHGAGQSYSNNHPSYPGGRDHGDVDLFLVPNELAASRWRTSYRQARVEVVGSPHAETLPGRFPGPGPVIAVSFHGTFAIVPETQSAFPAYSRALPAIAKSYQLIGHAHPLYMTQMAAWYGRNGIEVVDDFDDVCRRADLYVCDNSSTLFEFASTGRPVVVLNAPWFRRDASHGLRFWQAADVGVQCDAPTELHAAIERALTDEPDQREARERALNIAYGVRSGAASKAAAAITDWLAA